MKIIWNSNTVWLSFIGIQPCSFIYILSMTAFGEGNGTPLQYSCLENPMDRGAWRAAVHGVAEGRTRLSDFTFTFHFHALEKEVAIHSSVLAWRIPGTGELGRLPSMGSHRVGHDWSNLAAAAAWLLLHCKSRVKQLWVRPNASQSLKSLLSGLLQKKFSDSWSKTKIATMHCRIYNI